MQEGKKPGLWDNIHAKRKRMKAGSGESMRKPGSKGAPSKQDFKDASESTVEFGKSQEKIRDKQKNDKISSSDKSKLGKLSDMMKKANEETDVVVEEISKMSDSRLKFHATKGVPHGSYSTKQIKDEHNERKQTKTYQAAKATMNEEEVEEGAMKRLATQQQTGEKGSGLDTFKRKPKDTSQGKKNLQDEMSPEAKANRLQMIKNAARKQAAKNDAAAVAAAKRDYAKSSKRGLAPVKMDESFDVYSMTDEQIALLTKTEAYKLIDHINNILTGE
jgi:hypothetical protein